MVAHDNERIYALRALLIVLNNLQSPIDHRSRRKLWLWSHSMDNIQWDDDTKKKHRVARFIYFVRHESCLKQRLSIPSISILHAY